ncbi:hypothetical protein [Ruminococcus sp. Marseille-P6503]|uniref:hypothetical protein n=1 Tax=Ruminococcus sp. Marseille-P6503 TaxID=2364796 RepID=UPI000F54653B|nr:hypothetical protein [Ruminococcus sp. Marseille-P6503]
MGEVSIDKLSIEISGNADKAVKSLDKLTACLERLEKSIENCKGLNTVSRQIEKLTAAAARIQGGKLKELSAYIDKLSASKPPSFERLIGQIERLSAAASGVSGTERLAQNILDIADAVKPLETIEKTNLGSVVGSLRKIPEFIKAMDTSALDDFKNYIERITEALKPLTTEVRKSEKGLESLNGIMQSVVAENGNLASNNAVSVKSYTSLSSVLKDVKVKILACSYALYKLAGSMYGWFKESNDYIENLNLFTVAMGDASEEALNYAEKVSGALGIDMSEWIRNQGVFKQVTSGFGVAAEQSNLMSKNLTQLGYDISSFFNIDIDESMQKLQSGISGEIEPLRRLGYALDTATLQQVAYNLGISQNINQMTQAQKSQLRYIAIMQQSSNAMGDMARTVATPANSIRILEQQFTQLKRALGNIVSVVAVKLIPYIQVAIRLLTDLAQSLAERWGFEMPQIDYSAMGDGLSNVTDEADIAAESVQETVKEMQRLAGFDEINVLSSGAGSGSETVSAAGGSDLGVELPEYDFLAGLDEQTDELYQQAKKKIKEFTDKVRSLYEWFKKNKKIVGDLLKLLALLWAVSKLKKLIDKVHELYKWFKELKIIKTAKKWLDIFITGFKKSEADTFFGKLSGGFKSISDEVKKFRDKLSPVQKLLGTIVGTVVASYGSYNLFYDLAGDTLTWKSALVDSAEIVGGLAASWIFGGGKGLAVGFVATAFSGLYGWIKKCVEASEEAYLKISGLSDNGGVKVSDLTQMFSDQYNQIIETSDKIQEYKQTISDNDGTISTAIENVENFNTAFGDGKNAMSEEDLEYITGQFETIAKSVKDNVGTATQSILESFSDKIKQVADNIGIDLSKVISSLKGFESEMKSNVDEAETIVTNYQQMLFDGITPTAEQTNEYERAYSYLIDKTRTQSTELSNAKEEMQNAIDFSKLDFENPETFEKSMEDLNTKTKEALQAVKDTYKTSSDALEEFYTEIQLQYRHGFLSDDQYALAMQTYEETKQILKADMEQSKKDIKTDLATLTGAIQSEYDRAIDDIATYKAELAFKSNGKSVEEVKKYNRDSWNAEYELQKSYVKRVFGDLQDTIDIATKDLDISPDISLGEAWLSQMSENEKAAFPSVIVEENERLNLINENRVKHMNYNLEKLGINTSSKLKESINFNSVMQSAEKVAYTFGLGLKNGEGSIIERLIQISSYPNSIFNNPLTWTNTMETANKNGQSVGYSSVTGMAAGFSMGNALAAGAVNGVMQSVKLAVDSVNLSSQGYNAMQTYSGGFSSSKNMFFENLLGIGNEVASYFNIDLTETGKGIGGTLSKGFSDGSISLIDMYNKILGKSEEFSVQMMNAYNDAVPIYQKMINGISIAAGAGMSAANIDYVSYTAKGRRIKGYADGGFPDYGELFIANERGPELVGQIGGRTAVANQGQITDAIYSAVLDAMRMSGKGTSQGQGDVNVYIDSDEVAARVEYRQYTKSKRLGG